MSAELSLYLDLVRIFAAILVLLAHTDLRVLSDTIPLGSGFGHSAVVVFFVLSGFVISYVTDTREKSPRKYAVSRVSRIYSVVIPALVLGLVLDTAGRWISPGVYAAQPKNDWLPVRVLATLTFMNEPWGISIMAFTAPFWSVAYEGWYYILFGLTMFWTGRARQAVLVVALLLCGPKVLLLFPIWLAGVYLQRSRILATLRPRPAVALYVLSVLLVASYHWFGGPHYFRGVVERIVGREFQLNRMTWSGEFLGDYLVGAMVVLNFAAFQAAAPILGAVIRPLEKPIKWAASFTFSLYLYHRQFILFYVACLRGDTRSYAFYFEVLSLVLISVCLLGSVTEHRKQWCRRATDRLFTAIERMVLRARLRVAA